MPPQPPDAVLPLLQSLSRRLFACVTALSAGRATPEALLDHLLEYLEVTSAAAMATGTTRSPAAKAVLPCVLRTIYAVLSLGGDLVADAGLNASCGGGSGGGRRGGGGGGGGAASLQDAFGCTGARIRWNDAEEPGSAAAAMAAAEAVALRHIASASICCGSETGGGSSGDSANGNGCGLVPPPASPGVYPRLCRLVVECINYSGVLEPGGCSPTLAASALDAPAMTAAPAALELATALLGRANEEQLLRCGRSLLDGGGLRRLLSPAHTLDAALRGRAIDLVQCLVRSPGLFPALAHAGAANGFAGGTADAVAAASGAAAAAAAQSRSQRGGGNSGADGDVESARLLRQLCADAMAAALDGGAANRTACLKAVRLAATLCVRYGDRGVAALLLPAATPVAVGGRVGSGTAAGAADRPLFVQLIELLSREMDAWEAERDMIMTAGCGGVDGGGSVDGSSGPDGIGSGEGVAVMAPHRATLIREAFALLAALAPRSAAPLVSVAQAAGQCNMLVSLVSRLIEYSCREEDDGGGFDLSAEVALLSDLINSSGGWETQAAP
ncbi:unnamed protein product [Phaeothamnion confervicola]